MAFYIKISNEKTFILPTDIPTQERIALCNSIIEQNPEYFTQQISKPSKNESTASSKVCSRLDIMATYILNGEARGSKQEYALLSAYKEGRNKATETIFSSIDR